MLYERLLILHCIERIEYGHLMALCTHHSHWRSEISSLHDLNALIHSVAEHFNILLDLNILAVTACKLENLATFEHRLAA